MRDWRNIRIQWDGLDPKEIAQAQRERRVARRFRKLLWWSLPVALMVGLWQLSKLGAGLDQEVQKPSQVTP